MDRINKFNEEYNQDFKKIPYNERAIFLPHCLRNKDCPAKTTDEGVQCISCGKCNIHKIKEYAESLGYRVFIVPGASLVKNLVKKYKPKAAIGVACGPELEESLKFAPKIGIIPQCVSLLKDGCVETEVDWDKVKEAIGLKD